MILALDYGSRFVGVAITDGDERLALRHSVIDLKEKDVFVEVKKIVLEEKVEKILVGLPISLSGEDSEQTRKTRGFASGLKEVVGDEISVELVDERFSSKEAERRVALEGGKKEDAHAEAARLILESYLR